MVKRYLCVNVTSGLDALELALLSDDQQQIQRVASVALNVYEPVTRRVAMAENMQDAIKQLFAQAKQPLGNLPVVLILPTYFSNHLEMSEGSLKAEDVQMVVLGEVESHYVFKSHDPVLDWIPLDDKKVYYSAFVKEDVDSWVEAFQTLRTPVIAIDNGFFSLLRGLMATGAIQNVVEHERPWLLLLLTDSSCQMGIFQGYQLKWAEDIPLGTEDITMAVQDVAIEVQRLLQAHVVDQLVMVNNTLRIDTSVLKTALAVELPTIDIVQNKYTVESLGATESVLYPCTLEALGGGLYHQLNYLPQCNFAPKGNLRTLETDQAKQTCFKYLVVANIVAAVFCAVVWGGFQGLLMLKQSKLPKVDQGFDPASANGPASAKTPKEIAIARKKAKFMATEDEGGLDNEQAIYSKLFSKTLAERNFWLNNLLVVVGKKMPQGSWLNTVDVSNLVQPDKTSVKIEGATENSESLQGLQQAVSETLQKSAPSLISVDADKDDPKLFHWVLGTADIAKTTAGPDGLPGKGGMP
jgi:hypothetical protein